MTIHPCHNLSISDIDRLEENIYGYNRESIGHHDGSALSFEALDASGVQIAAVAGYSWAGMAEIRQLWVDAGSPGAGFGSRAC